LDTGKIHEDNITMHDLKHFQKAALINAMLDLDEQIFIDMKNILLP